MSPFFAPSTPKRPSNFVVVKYFLLGLLISNSIESVLIIPKILDVLDQSAIQTKKLEEMDIKRAEVKALLEERQRAAKEIGGERDRELHLLESRSESVHGKEKHEKTPKHLREREEEEKEKEREDHEKNKLSHGGGERNKLNGKKKEKKLHQLKGEPHKGEERSEEEEKELEEQEEQEEEEAEKKAEEKVHHEVRKRPQRLETGNNFVAVFMLFYGSTTLCLGVPAIFKESIRLLQGLMVVSCVGTLILVSTKFSLIMIMSVVKDVIIVALTFYYIQMISSSDVPVDAAADSTIPMNGANVFPGAMDASVTIGAGVTAASDAINAPADMYPPQMPVDYAAVAAQQQMYPAAGQTTTGW